MMRNPEAIAEEEQRHVRRRWMLWAEWFARVTLAAVFLYAAVPKIFDTATFAKDIANYHAVPEALVPWVAVIVPWLEGVAALSVLIGIAMRGGALVLGALLVAFIVLLSQAILRGIRLDCGCFGAENASEVTWWSVARNVGLLAGVGWILWVRSCTSLAARAEKAADDAASESDTMPRSRAMEPERSIEDDRNPSGMKG